LDVDEAGARRAAADLVAAGSRAIACKVDVSVRAQVNAALGRVHAELGPVQILVNNAVLLISGPFSRSPKKGGDRIMSVNLKSMLTCTQAVLPDMLAARWGRVINISSSSAQAGSARMTAMRLPRAASSPSHSRWRSSSQPRA